MIKNNLCPVCGFDLGFLAWEDEFPSDEICPSCGIQFGYDDIRDGEFREGQYHEWRKKWILEGCNWYSQNSKPESFNPEIQLRNIGVDL